MKIKYVGLVLLGLLALFTAFSCKSTPAADTSAPPPDREAPDQASLNALEAAEDRALAAKKLVSDFDGPDSFPADWKNANTLLTEADRYKNTSTIQETRESTDRFIKAAEAFEEMGDKVLGQYYISKEAELVSARNAAVNAGAEELIPDFLLDADNTVAGAVDKYQAKDYYAARDAAADALAMYGVLKSGLDAYAVREAITERNLDIYDPLSIELADDTLRSAADDYSARNFAGAKDKTEAALLRYSLAIKTAWEAYAADKGAEAAEDRQEALDLKANVAARQEYNSAQDVFTRANAAFSAQKYEDAALGFEDSVKRFSDVIATTRQKRSIAEEALERANQKMAESDETAKYAEIILEGGE